MSSRSPRSVQAVALAVCLITAGATAGAQPPSPSAPLAPVAAAGEQPAASRRADSARGAALSARYHVRQMENVLERAVEHAADMMRRRLQAVTPDVLALAGTPRAQGFRLDGYGLFFSVEVPRLSETVNWALRVLSQDRDERVLASLQKVIASEQDPVLRADLERAIRTVQLQLSLVPRAPSSAQRRASVTAPVTSNGGSLATVDAAAATPLAADAAPAPAPELPAEPFVDPSAAYEDEVKNALVDAMLDYAGSLPLPDVEWVTVAARDAGYMAFPDAVSEMVTVTLSVRVADLVEFRAQRLTRDEARTRVVMKEF